ncbi:MAG TPA: hypothetical protein VJ739_01985 [Gemmataceae bacterium]|nr:hypothetical protein [Gemmataceae bacterium]
MAPRPLRTLALLAAAALIAGPAFADKGADKKAKQAQIKQLEGQIHQAKEQEKAALKAIDQRYERLIRSMEPKAVHQQLGEALQVVRQAHGVISVGDFDYGGHRGAAQHSLKAAEHQLDRALHHDTAAERARAAHDLEAAHEDVSKALAYSLRKYGLGNGRKDGGEPETRAAANRQLQESVSKMEFAHHLLAAVDHEIKDYKEEKKALRHKRDAEKRTAKEQHAAQVKQLEQQIRALKK